MRPARLFAILACLSLLGTFAVPLSARAAISTAGTYHPVTSTRLLDTRTGAGLADGKPKKLAGGTVLTLTVAGHGGVPTSGVSAVVINLTATSGTVGSYLTAYAGGTSRPSTSTINYPASYGRANNATVALGTGGKIVIYNGAGSVNVMVDVVGYYANGSAGPTGTANEFTTVEPERLIDTRTDQEGILGAKNILSLFIDFGDNGEQNASVAAVAVNVTAVGAQGAGYLTTYDGGDKLPNTSTVNFPNSAAIANLAVVKTRLCDDCGIPPAVQFAVYNGSTEAVHVIVDLVGIYYHDGTVGLRFKPLSPVRIKDSRTSPASPLGAAATQTLTAPASLVVTSTEALVSNLTAAPSANTYLTAWRAGDPRPAVSNLNASARVTAANAAIIELSTTNKFSVYNNAGTSSYLVDVVGRFDVGDGAALARTRMAALPRMDTSSVHSQRDLVSATR